MTVRSNGDARWTVLALLSIGLLVAACTTSASSIAPPTLEAGPTAAPTERPTERPTETAAATIAEPTDSIVSPPPSEQTEQTEPPMAQPPDASLAVAGGDPVVGELGSFTWGGGGSDSPWLPGSPINVGNGERFMLTLADPIGIDSWTADYVPAAAVQSATPAGLADGTGEPVIFSVPPPGSWSVHVSVLFAEGLGSAAYFWLVEVD